MPKLACNGFSFFANHCRVKLEQHRGRKFKGMEDLIEAANPLWQKLSENEKRLWKEQARDYKKTDEYYERKRATRRKGPRRTRKGEEEEQEGDDNGEFDSDDDPGVPVLRSHGPASVGVAGGDTISEGGVIAGNVELSVGDLEMKIQEDKARIYEFLATSSGGRLEDVKRCRFLQVSVQTYGHLEEGMCIPAELAIVEWSLAKGVMNEYFRILGPWEIPDKLLRERAVINARATHRIPLDGCPEYLEYTMSRRAVMREVLGRTEPGIAVDQGVKVGLYENGLTEEVIELPDGETKRGFPILPGDMHGRRWVVVLESEYRSVMEAIRFLKRSEKIGYDGFPLTPDRFILFRSLLETLGEFVHAPLPDTTQRFLKALKEPSRKPEKYKGTPWDQTPEMYCSYHQDEMTGHCALAQCRKATFTAFHSLKLGYDLPFEDPSSE